MEKWIHIFSVLTRGRARRNETKDATLRSAGPIMQRQFVAACAIRRFSPLRFVQPLLSNQEWCNFHWLRAVPVGQSQPRIGGWIKRMITGATLGRKRAPKSPLIEKENDCPLIEGRRAVLSRIEWVLLGLTRNNAYLHSEDNGFLFLPSFKYAGCTTISWGVLWFLVPSFSFSCLSYWGSFLKP